MFKKIISNMINTNINHINKTSKSSGMFNSIQGVLRTENLRDNELDTVATLDPFNTVMNSILLKLG